jgi:hypothetical protein
MVDRLPSDVQLPFSDGAADFHTIRQILLLGATIAEKMSL